MKQWYANELSKLTHVSVRTLHHYDKVGLLCPTRRLANGYRVYSEADLLKLQHIIALKFFGFELHQIKKLLTDDINQKENLEMQARFLQEKANRLMQASEILQKVTKDSNVQESISWEKIIELIEVYHMTQEFENTWVANVLNEKELKQYAEFEKDLKTRFTLEEKEKFEKAWAALLNEMEENLSQDPTSPLGIEIGQRCMTLMDSLYTKDHLNLRTKIWKEGFRKGKGGTEHGMTPAMVTWLDKAINTYWRQRIYTLLSQIATLSKEQSFKQWNDLMAEMYGDDQMSKDELLEIALKESDIGQEAKQWLKTMKK